jgi:cation:H+ antiporter
VVALQIALFAAGAAISLSTSYLLVTRLERIGERLGMSEALLGLLAALAADAPEITSAVAALTSGQHAVGAGVVIGSNVFNLAALLGLGAVVAGSIALHRRVVLLGGLVGIWVAAICLITVLGAVSPFAGLLLVLAVMVPYTVVLGAGRARLARLPVVRRWEAWLAVAISEEETELQEVIHPRRAHRNDVLLAIAALLVVVAASLAMERSATDLGSHFGVPEIVTGGVVLAAVTSLPNAVSAVYLAARGRGAAMLSTTLNSNALNVTAGLLLPGAIAGLGAPSAHSVLIAVWYLGMTVGALAFAYRDSSVSRAVGALIIGAYLVFLGSLFTTAHATAPSAALTVVPFTVVMAGCVLGLARRPRRSR